MEKDLEILEEFRNNHLQRDKFEIDNRCGGFKMGKIYKLTELNPALQHLIQAYKEQQAELEKKDKIINEMSKIISIVMTDIKVVKSQFEKEYCDFINSNEECCWKTDSDCTDCIKQYFERKVEDDIK